MAREGSNKYMNQAKSGKNDEFYTILSDIEKELKHYKKHFKGKTVLCNCDDPRISNFFHYFSSCFPHLNSSFQRTDPMSAFSRVHLSRRIVRHNNRYARTF
ncbi:MAG: hypothetical protein IIC67_10765 [Thaumarchaeota archaeon]|nr:hypothetical protein [Nitrososphaerota archaeon]